MWSPKYPMVCVEDLFSLFLTSTVLILSLIEVMQWGI